MSGAMLDEPSQERRLPLVTSSAPGRRDARPGLSGVAPDDLASWLASEGQPAYRARQIADALWRGSAADIGSMHTLPAALRTRLTEAFRVDTLVATETQAADEGLTEKALHTLDDGRLIESVLMRYPARTGQRERSTVCISSQAGCAVGCPFCATGELGFLRDLETAEIVDQVRSWQRRLAIDGRRVTNVVFMGMGEPLLNAERVVAAASALTDARRFGLGARHITISTSGVVPGIERLARDRPQYTLAVSLHAARPTLRDVLVPLNRRYPVDEVVRAAVAYARMTGRRVSYESVMIEGINDTPDDADAMAVLLAGQGAHVNLIPMNPVAHTPWQPSSPARIATFAGRLRAAGMTVTIRRNRGIEIGAACGQLAAERAAEPPPEAVRRRRDQLESASRDALLVGPR
ncbi:MAG TPA: 23S rRNA (adenine(2503)-C(2))-methyltransferase RlmN [Candidatus Limnocylindrales bacterium]|jgi:23S rRNA (adenine2503-C2)-methyltransferase